MKLKCDDCGAEFERESEFSLLGRKLCLPCDCRKLLQEVACERFMDALPPRWEPGTYIWTAGPQKSQTIVVLDAVMLPGKVEWVPEIIQMLNGRSRRDVEFDWIARSMRHLIPYSALISPTSIEDYGSTYRVYHPNRNLVDSVDEVHSLMYRLSVSVELNRELADILYVHIDYDRERLTQTVPLAYLTPRALDLEAVRHDIAARMVNACMSLVNHLRRSPRGPRAARPAPTGDIRGSAGSQEAPPAGAAPGPDAATGTL